MKLLVTGGLGFIGSNFIRHELRERKGARVVNVDCRTYAGNPANLAGLENDPRYRWVKADISDAQAMARVMAEGFDAVVHFAAESHVDRSILDAAPFLKTNVLGTQVLLECAMKAKVPRFVHVSTDEVYGSVPKGHSKEGDPLWPNSPYAASKASSDLIARAYFVTHGFPVIVTRASNNFGPYQYPEKALPLMITNFLDDMPFPMYGDGRQVRDWLFVEDHARAIDFLLDKGQAGEIYNVGGTFSCENKDLIRRVRGLMGKPATLVKTVKDRPGHDRRYALDCSKLKRLGFKHAFNFEDALNITIEWYRFHQAWWRPLKSHEPYRAYYEKQYAQKTGARG